MAKVLLTHSYFYYFDPKQWAAKKPYPPLGTLYAASVLRKEGHEVDFFDNALQKSTKAFIEHLKASKADFLVIYDDGFNYLTKMCLTNMREAAIQMASEAKKIGMTVIISSSDSTDQYDLYLKNNMDYVLLGEAEDSLIALTNALLKRENIDNIKGIAFQKSGEMVKTHRNPVIRDLDTLPFPSWDLIDLSPYQEMWRKNHGYFSLNVSTTRGCPYKCNWCAKPIYGNRYNSRSPKKVVEEMAMLQEKYQVDEFWITDDIFGLKPGWVQDFEKESKKKNCSFNYKIQSRVDLMLKDKNLESMIESGLKEVWVGAESGSQKILDAMDKGITIDQIREATKKVQERGRRICFFLQFGYIDENEEDINKTIEMLLELMPDDIGISVSYPLPGTKFYERVKSQLSNKANWTDSDDLDLMYEGNFSKDYYRKLHKKVHKLYRRKQGINALKNLPKYWKEFGVKDYKSIALSLLYYSPVLMYQNVLSSTKNP